MLDASPGPGPAALERIACDAAGAASALRDGDAGPVLHRLLTEATPHAGFVGAQGRSTVPTASLQWVVDPPDHAADGPPTAVSVAAAVDGEVVAAAVVDVGLAERFSAHLDGGARCDGRPIAASPCERLAAATVASGVPGTWALDDHVARAPRDTRAPASPALGLCWVGCGRLDGYVTRGVGVSTSAAGALVAEEAGAAVELPCPENDDLLVAATPGVSDALRAVVSRVA